jgi:hypothetical protein
MCFYEISINMNKAMETNNDNKTSRLQSKAVKTKGMKNYETTGIY